MHADAETPETGGAAAAEEAGGADSVNKQKIRRAALLLAL